MFNLAAGPGDPYDTFDLVTALMLEATRFLVTEGVDYPPGAHPLPRGTGPRCEALSRRRLKTLLQELLEVVLKVLGGHRTLGGVGDGLLAEVVEGEGAGRGEPAAAGLLQDEAHQLQGDLGLALALLHTRDRLSEGLSRALYRRGLSMALW
jgi:hypothetical protein